MTALAYCTVIGKFADLVVDGSDGGADPDAAPLVGQVTLTCDARDLSGNSTPRLLLPSETPPRTITVEPFPVTLDGTGAFSVEVPATGQTGVTVPSVFTYTASFALKTATGAKVRLPSFSFSAPAGTTVDLANVAPAATENGVNYIVGPAGAPGAGAPPGGTPDGYVATAHSGATVWSPPAGGSTLTPQTVQTASFTAAIDKFWPIDTTSATPIVVPLPTAPADGKQVELKVVAGPTASGLLTHPVTVNLGGSDVLNVAGGAATFQIRELNQGVTLQYKASTAIWYVVSDDLSLAQLQAMFAPITANRPLSGLGTALESQTLYAYGHSYVVGISTASTEPWITRAARAVAATVNNRGISGDRADDTAARLIGFTGMGSGGSFGGTAWTPSTRAAVALECWLNDLRFAGASTANRTGVKHAIRYCLAVLNGGTIIDTSDSSVTFTGTWTGNAIADAIGGNTKSTTVQNAHVDIAFTGTEITLLTFGLVAAQGTATYTLDPAGANTNLGSANYGGQGANDTGLSFVRGYFHVAARFTGLPAGAHVLRVTKSDAGAGSVFADGYVLPSATPPTILVGLEPPIPTASYTSYSPYNNGSEAARATLTADVLSVIAEFGSNVVPLDLGTGFDPTTMTSTTDNIHPDDAGTGWMSQAFVAAARGLAYRAGLNKT